MISHAADKAETTGGHAEMLKFNDDGTMTKMAPAAEGVIYRAIFGVSLPTDTISRINDRYEEIEYPITPEQRAQLLEWRELVPNYISGEETMVTIQAKGKGGNAKMEPATKLTIENLTWGMDKPAIMDVKIGEHTATKRAKRRGADHIKLTYERDDLRTSSRLGFTIVGINSEEGRVYKAGESMNPQNVDSYLMRPFKHNGQLNVEALDYSIGELEKMIHLFKHVNTFEVRGCSVFFVLDHNKKLYKAKLIDLSSFEEQGSPDTGVLHGVVSLHSMLCMYRNTAKATQKGTEGAPMVHRPEVGDTVTTVTVTTTTM
jgi:hypothetical protein